MNWKAFNEAYNDPSEDDEKMDAALRREMRHLSGQLEGLVEALSVPEMLARRSAESGNTRHIEMLADLFVERVCQEIAKLMEHTMPENHPARELMVILLVKAAHEGKSVMVKDSMSKGLHHWFQAYAEELIQARKSMNGDGPREDMEKETDVDRLISKQNEEPKPLSNSQIMSMIDDALDKRDFKEVSRLQAMLKESKTDTSHISRKASIAVDSICKKVAQVFMTAIETIIKKHDQINF